ncbi:hypothetical protein BU17DRAFT_67880 [Hysterangium stoloniferum]|nr:hypothetical protein BU17DRAFT_67880 [Hysterangium stoloniferum]
MSKRPVPQYSMGSPPHSLKLDLRDPIPESHPDSEADAFLARIPFAGLRGELVIQIPQFDDYFREPFVIRVPDTTPRWTVYDVLTAMQRQFVMKARQDHQRYLDGIDSIREARSQRLGTAEPSDPYLFVDILGKQYIFDGLMWVTLHDQYSTTPLHISSAQHSPAPHTILITPPPQHTLEPMSWIATLIWSLYPAYLRIKNFYQAGWWSLEEQRWPGLETMIFQESFSSKRCRASQNLRQKLSMSEGSSVKASLDRTDHVRQIDTNVELWSLILHSVTQPGNVANSLQGYREDIGQHVKSEMKLLPAGQISGSSKSASALPEEAAAPYGMRHNCFAYKSRARLSVIPALMVQLLSHMKPKHKALAIRVLPLWKRNHGSREISFIQDVAVSFPDLEMQWQADVAQMTG